jgi:hypothetical protein
VEGSTESCGPAREEGICKFGMRLCTGGQWGVCTGATFAKERDCSSTADNDCDGQRDDTQGDVCKCPSAGSRACDDGLACSIDDHCVAGVCQGTPRICDADTPVCSPLTGNCVCNESEVRCVGSEPNRVERCTGGAWVTVETCVWQNELCSNDTHHCECAEDSDPATTAVRDLHYGCGLSRKLSTDPTGAWIRFEQAKINVDLETGLSWYGPTGAASLAELQATCQSLVASGQFGWRVPTIDDVRKLTGGCPEADAGVCMLSDPACLSSACAQCNTTECRGGAGPAAQALYCRPNVGADCHDIRTSSRCTDCADPTATWTFQAINAIFVTKEAIGPGTTYCVAAAVI